MSEEHLPIASFGGRISPIQPRRHRRRILLDGVNLGDGKLIRAWLIIDKDKVTIRKFRSPKAWTLVTAEAAGVIARRAQLKACG
jgi:hypothetical protein